MKLPTGWVPNRLTWRPLVRAESFPWAQLLAWGLRSILFSDALSTPLAKIRPSLTLLQFPGKHLANREDVENVFDGRGVKLVFWETKLSDAGSVLRLCRLALQISLEGQRWFSLTHALR